MQVAFLLRCVEVPDHVVWQAINPVTGNFCQLCKPLCFDLMIHWFDRKVDTWLVSRETVLEGGDEDESVGLI